MLSEELKEHTKIAHQLLEKKLVTCIKAIGTPQQYAALLTWFYGFFYPLEKAVQEHLDPDVLPDYPQRRKAAALASDLEQLHTTLPAVAVANDLPSITNHFQALGALYVMEGSTLGGSVISKMICRQLNCTNMAGLSFFSGYQEQTGHMWKVFKNSIDQPLQKESAHAVIRSADDTFILLRHWFERQPSFPGC